MARNDNLHESKRRKNDEFYTLEQSIVDEIDAHEDYVRQFRGKSVYCNCDSEESSFVRFFLKRFKEYGLKKLTATHWNADGSPSCKTEWVDDGNGPKATRTPLQGDGDFRSEECVEVLKEADIVATNPPFSLLREYMKVLVDSGKKFIIIGPMNALHYKDIFPLIRDNKIWTGFSFNKTIEFIMPDDYELKGKAFIDKDGRKHGFVPGILWFTNLDIEKRHERFFKQEEVHAYYEGNEDSYPSYVNGDGIDVDHVEKIPIDYTGIMGVPDSFFNYYNPEDFEVVGYSGDRQFAKYMKDCVPPDSIYSTGGPSFYIQTGDKKYKRLFSRILIRNRHPVPRAVDEAM